MGIILSLLRVSGWKTGDEADQIRPISLNLTRPFSTLFQILGERLYCTSKRILRKICSDPISLYRCLMGVFHTIKTIFYSSKPRKTAVPLLPIENPTPNLEQSQEYSSETKNSEDSVRISIPNPSSHVLDSYSTSSITYTDHSVAIIQENVPHQKNEYSYAAEHDQPGICISAEKKCEESSEERESEVEKVVVVENARWIKHYSNRHRILLVGEGDFSFSCSLAVAFGCASRMVATSLDSKAFLKKNYAKAPWNIGELKKRGCIVMHEIDATKIATHQLLEHLTFDRIIYNFPFAGFFKELSRDSSLRRHRRLVSLFLMNAKKMIDEDGEIHISHKTNGYHKEWKLVSMASSHGLRLIEEVAFKLSDYPGYNTKRGFGGDENFGCYPSNTFKFGLKFVC